MEWSGIATYRIIRYIYMILDRKPLNLGKLAYQLLVALSTYDNHSNKLYMADRSVAFDYATLFV